MDQHPTQHPMPEGRTDLADAYRSESVAQAWQRGAAARSGALGPLTEIMLDLAGVGPGSRVLDVAAGTGEQTMLAARRVGPSGRVLAVDISPEMLALAAEQAQAAGLANVETLAIDAHALDLAPDSFDAAICRSGLMLMADPVAVLARVYRALKPGGRLSVLVFGPADANPLQWLPTRIAREAAGLPPLRPGEPGMFALGEPGRLERAFQTAGFVDISAQAVATSRRFASAADAVLSLRDMLPSVHAILRTVSEPARERVWAEIEVVLRPLEGPDGLVAPGAFLLGVGTKARRPGHDARCCVSRAPRVASLPRSHAASSGSAADTEQALSKEPP